MSLYTYRNQCIQFIGWRQMRQFSGYVAEELNLSRVSKKIITADDAMLLISELFSHDSADEVVYNWQPSWPSYTELPLMLELIPDLAMTYTKKWIDESC